jgi:hypothetical protein
MKGEAMPHTIHTLLAIALLMPFVGLALGMVLLIGGILARGAK